MIILEAQQGYHQTHFICSDVTQTDLQSFDTTYGDLIVIPQKNGTVKITERHDFRTAMEGDMASVQKENL